MSKDTLQLPKTAFSMKASLPAKEPKILENWEKNKIFEKLEKIQKEKKNLYFMTGLLMPMAIFIWGQRLTKY
jgi:isoleucyl-tRNA synthetase